MAEVALVESQVLETFEFVKALDAAGDPPAVVVWADVSELDQWRMFLASPALDLRLATAGADAYDRVVEVLIRLGLVVSLGPIELVRMDHPIIQAGLARVRTGPRDLVRRHHRSVLTDAGYCRELLIFRAASADDAAS